LPRSSGRDAGADVAAVRPDLLRDQGKVALRVRVALNEGALVAELGLEPLQVGEDAVVREGPSVHGIGMGVLDRPLSGRGEADMGDERRRADVLRLAAEGRVLEGRQRLLVEDRSAVRSEKAEACPIRVSPALLDEAVRRLEEPEARVHPLGRGAQTEEPAHQSASTAT
jgi:hypothetical protein